ncbi:MAG: HDOD domain-containing protein [Nitrosomonadales bacterium]|nr:HDOD domain-containing protein [Nitrosomonadales bacterium]
MLDDTQRQKLKRALENVNSLPAMPVIAQKLLALPLDTDKGETQLIQLIGQDPQISARIIGLSNSPMMGLARKINVVNDAVMVLGLTKVKSVAIGIASMSNFSKLPPGSHFDPHNLWLHSMATAIIMRSIAKSMPRNLRPDEDQIFLVGLLHDIGFMALHHVDPVASNEVHRQLQLQAGRPVLEVEKETLGVTHCHIGMLLAKNWNLSPDITTVLGNHHPPYADKAMAQNPLVGLLNLTEKLAPDFGIVEHTGQAVTDQDWQNLGIPLSDTGEIVDLVHELVLQVAQQGGTL